MTTPPDDIPARCQKVWTAVAEEPRTKEEIAAALDLSPATIEGYIDEIQQAGYAFHADSHHRYHLPDDWDTGAADDEDNEDEADADYVSDSPAVGLDGVEADPDADPSPGDLTDREHYIAQQLQTGATVDELADDLDERPSVVSQHLRDLKRRGWQVYIDESAGHVTIEGDHALRSSEHKGTRTRKANRWWELRHNELVRQWNSLETTDVPQVAHEGHEDWVTHITDLHAGDRERDYCGDVVYETAEIPHVVEYITQQSISLAQKHNSVYDTAHLLYGGDLVTGEAIYEGQFEDLDAWLDEQVDVIQRALVEQVYTFADHFDHVNIVCQVGNHGQNRASGTSRQNNADLLVYKHLRNVIAQVQDRHTSLTNVSITIGEARPYTPVALRGGKLHGQLRHGQDRKPQAETSARLKEWLSTLLDTVNSDWGAFDVAWMGHHHVSGRIPWNGPPIIVSGSPKPAGDYVERLGTKGQETLPKEIAHCHGVSDDGITSIWPIDTRDYDREEAVDPLSEWQWGPQ
jgi:DNA-binding CsgD family transcriptional regulator